MAQLYKLRVAQYSAEQLKNGDWEITTEDGSKWIEVAEHFAHWYEPIGKDDGAADAETVENVENESATPAPSVIYDKEF